MVHYLVLFLVTIIYEIHESYVTYENEHILEYLDPILYKMRHNYQTP